MSGKISSLENKLCENDVFIPEGLGSAEKVSLDGKSEIEETDLSTRGAPWDMDQSFKAKCAEVGVDFNEFIEGLKANRSDKEIGKELGLTTKAAANLRYHFERYGYHSMEGQD